MKTFTIQCGALVLAVAMQLTAAASVVTATEKAPPGVSSPILPQTRDGAVSGGGEVKTWKPGDPVRIVPDLREDQDPSAGAADQPSISAPIVRAPMTPQVLEGDLRALQKAEPYREGEPVRVVPDLREDGTRG